MDDLIKRSDAIETIDANFSNIPIEQTTEILKVRRAIRELPSAQTDNELIQVIEAQRQLIEEYKERVHQLEELDNCKTNLIRELQDVVMKGADDE